MSGCMLPVFSKALERWLEILPAMYASIVSISAMGRR